MAWRAEAKLTPACVWKRRAGLCSQVRDPVDALLSAMGRFWKVDAEPAHANDTFLREARGMNIAYSGSLLPGLGQAWLQ